MKTLILKIEYDGTNYAGWQFQKNAASIQGELQIAASKLFGCPISIVGAGRTDAGVHARGQIGHSKFENEIRYDTATIIKAMNSYLPDEIKVADARQLDGSFHSVRDAISREYSYSIHIENHPLIRLYSAFIKFPIDKEKLFSSSEQFVGEYDFTTFSKLNQDIDSYICKVSKCLWIETAKNQFQLQIKANRFVYGMVRSLVGAMLDAARGKRSIDDLKSALDSKDRQFSSPLAAANGLVLEKVEYNFELFDKR